MVLTYPSKISSQIIALILDQDISLLKKQELSGLCAEAICTMRGHQPSRVTPTSCDCGQIVYDD